VERSFTAGTRMTPGGASPVSNSVWRPPVAGWPRDAHRHHKWFTEGFNTEPLKDARRFSTS
jgi:hypothetical protein